MNQANRQVLGVIGGLGPIATAHFLELVIQMTDAQSDQQHLDMIIYNTPSTPDRTGFLLGQSSESPLPKLLYAGRGLANAAVSYIAVPCVTAHSFLPELEKELGIPLIDGVRETALHLKSRGITRVGILATDGTLATGLFHRELELLGMEAITPSPRHQQDVMELIYGQIKAGKPVELSRFFSAAAELRHTGAQAIILGCTELSLVKRDHAIGPGFIDVMEVLAQRAITLCGKTVKPCYENLISK